MGYLPCVIMAAKKKPAIIEMTEAEINALQERIKNKQLLEEDYPILGQTIQFVLWVGFVS